MPKRARSELSRHSYRARTLKKRRQSERASGLSLNIMSGHHSQDTIYIKSEFPGNDQTSYAAEETQKFDFEESMKIIPASMIKKEIIDPSEQSGNLVSNDYTQYKSAVDFIAALETEITESFDIDLRLNLPSIKVEPLEDEDKSLRTGKSFESKGSTSAFEYKLTKCSVLLHDCLLPENLALLSSRFKSLKINKDTPQGFFNDYLYPSNESPLFSHCYDVYNKILPPQKTPLPRYLRVALNWNDKYLKKKKLPSKPRSCALPRRERNRREQEKICTCNKAVTIGTELDEYSNVSAQQLCSCFRSDNLLVESTKFEDISIFNPDFGKIAYGINNI